jgi:hypothetical protein
MQTLRAYEEVVDFIASTNPGKVLAFRPSEETKQRVSDLIDKEKNNALTAEEKSELDYYMQLEHLMRMVKIRAHQHLNK